VAKFHNAKHHQKQCKKLKSFILKKNQIIQSVGIVQVIQTTNKFLSFKLTTFNYKLDFHLIVFFYDNKFQLFMFHAFCIPMSTLKCIFLSHISFGI
jgi:hypothetical protein